MINLQVALALDELTKDLCIECKDAKDKSILNELLKPSNYNDGISISRTELNCIYAKNNSSLIYIKLASRVIDMKHEEGELAFTSPKIVTTKIIVDSHSATDEQKKVLGLLNIGSERLFNSSENEQSLESTNPDLISLINKTDKEFLSLSHPGIAQLTTVIAMAKIRLSKHNPQINHCEDVSMGQYFNLAICLEDASSARRIYEKLSQLNSNNDNPPQLVDKNINIMMWETRRDFMVNLNLAQGNYLKNIFPEEITHYLTTNLSSPTFKDSFFFDRNMRADDWVSRNHALTVNLTLTDVSISTLDEAEAINHNVRYYRGSSTFGQNSFFISPFIHSIFPGLAFLHTKNAKPDDKSDFPNCP